MIHEDRLTTLGFTKNHIIGSTYLYSYKRLTVYCKTVNDSYDRMVTVYVGSPSGDNKVHGVNTMEELLTLRHLLYGDNI